MLIPKNHKSLISSLTLAISIVTSVSNDNFVIECIINLAGAVVRVVKNQSL